MASSKLGSAGPASARASEIRLRTTESSVDRPNRRTPLDRVRELQRQFVVRIGERLRDIRQAGGRGVFCDREELLSIDAESTGRLGDIHGGARERPRRLEEHPRERVDGGLARAGERLGDRLQRFAREGRCVPRTGPSSPKQGLRLSRTARFAATLGTARTAARRENAAAFTYSTSTLSLARSDWRTCSSSRPASSGLNFGAAPTRFAPAISSMTRDARPS